MDSLTHLGLTALADKYGSDKGTVTSIPHRYTFLYDLLFAPLRHRKMDFLEMGLAVGGPDIGGDVDRAADSPSIRMWLEYFSQAHVYGFDISDFSHQQGPRFTFIRGDMGRPEDLIRLSLAAPAFDVIIDDASHASYHQQLALKYMFPRVAHDGLYIIEDCHWQSPIYEARLPMVPKTAHFLENFFLNGTYIPNELLPEQYMNWMRQKVISFAAFPAFGDGDRTTKLIVFRRG